MADRKSVRAELERKKIQLAQIRQERERRSRMLQDAENASQNSENRLEDADAVLNALGFSLSRASTVPSNVSSMDTSGISNQSPDIGLLAAKDSHQQFSSSLNDSFVISQTPTSSTKTPKPVVPLQVVHVNQINIPPKEKVYYTKSTQTLETPSQQTSQQQQQSGSAKSHYVLAFSDEEDELSYDMDGILTERQTRSTSTSAGISQVAGAGGDHELSEVKLELKEVTDDERKQIELREDYQVFIDFASKVLERALSSNESPEIFIQYFPDGSKGAIDGDHKNNNKLSLNRIFYDERWSKNRCINGFDWSTQYPELLLASYHTNEQAPTDPDGTLLVWNMKFKSTSPEYVFHCQSPIMSCCFAKFHPSLIVGGTYSGQIVLWDMRSNKRTPVQRSPLTAAAHTHPVYCAKLVGTQNAHNLISISTDGKLCSWSLDMLSAPQETLELNQQKQTRSVAVTCMSFHPDDYNNFLVGSEDGVVYSACRHGSKTGILSSYEAHQGFVTNIDYCSTDSQPGYSNTFLTSSIDWTVKLWKGKESEPVHSFESNGDYIYDVKWSPTNSSLFATVNGSGRVDIWNLATDLELPIASTVVEPLSTGDLVGQPSLNKLIWTPNGNQVVVGDDVGRIHVYDVGDVGDKGGLVRQEEKWKIDEQISRQ